MLNDFSFLPLAEDGTELFVKAMQGERFHLNRYISDRLSSANSRKHVDKDGRPVRAPFTMTKHKGEVRPLSPTSPVLLLGISVALTLLALFQWMELVLVRSGGQSICNINQTVNCEAVWNSQFASRIHGLLGMPVAGLGMVWGLTAFGAASFLVLRALSGASIGLPTAVIQLVGAVGLLVSLLLALESFRAGALCLTCLGTITLVVLYGVVAWKLLPDPLSAIREQLKPALAWTAGLAFASYLLLLGPGLATPRANSGLGKVERAGSSTSDGNADALKAYLSGLTQPEQQAVSNSLATYRRSPAPELRNFPVRRRMGPVSAPVKFVEFTDIRCGHCAQLLDVMKQIEKVVPSDRISIEARNFPLDAACNPALRGSDGTGIRCLGAKAQICLESAPDFWELRDKLFSEQETLTPERILEIASSGSMKRADLEACLRSPETNQKLSEDIAYAMLFSPQGTPLVLINGREAMAIPSFLLAMALTGANPDSPAFAALPPSHAGQP